MRICLVLAVALSWVGVATLPAQDYLVKQRAKGLRDQNNVRQGVPNPPAVPAPAPPAQPATSPTPRPTLSAAAQQNIDRLQTDLAALNGGSAEQKAQFATNLMSVTLTDAKPSAESLTKLATDLSQALSDKTLSSANRLRLARDLNAIINCTALGPETIRSVTADAQAVLKASGVAGNDATTVAEDLKAVAKEVKSAAK